MQRWDGWLGLTRALRCCAAESGGTDGLADADKWFSLGLAEHLAAGSCVVPRAGRPNQAPEPDWPAKPPTGWACRGAERQLRNLRELRVKPGAWRPAPRAGR